MRSPLLAPIFKLRELNFFSVLRLNKGVTMCRNQSHAHNRNHNIVSNQEPQ